GSACNPIATSRQLSHPGGGSRVFRATRSRWFQPDVRRGSTVGTAGSWLGRGESARHGSGHENSFQGVYHHEQFHDWSHGSGKRRGLLEPWLYRSGSGHAGDAGSTGRIAGGHTGFNEGRNEIITHHF